MSSKAASKPRKADPQSDSDSQPRLSPDDAVAGFAETLERFQDALESYLFLLLARDQVEASIRDAQSIPSAVSQQLILLDKELRQKLAALPAGTLLAWRTVMHPSQQAWWWYPISPTDDGQEKSDALWYLATGFLTLLSIGLALDILLRFWIETPDLFAVWATLVTVVLAALPFLKPGRDATEWLWEKLFHRNLNGRAVLTTLAAGLVLVLLFVIWKWVLPGPVTTLFNNEGTAAWASGNLSVARQKFQRAAILNPDQVVPYHNLAGAYLDSGLLDRAAETYQQAIEHDANFAPAYRGLGEVYNRIGNYGAAESVLVAGLSANSETADEVTRQVTQYELLSNLGWSYWGQEKLGVAQTTLANAVALEPELKTMGEQYGTEYRLALPHFYLAQIYEKTGELEQARHHWEESLRFLNADDWQQRERFLFAQGRLGSIDVK